jgi:hypothetical protein
MCRSSASNLPAPASAESAIANYGFLRSGCSHTRDRQPRVFGVRNASHADATAELMIAVELGGIQADA